MPPVDFANVTKFEVISDFVLRVHFDDNTVQLIDFLPALGENLFGPLRDKKVFSQVRLDPESQNLVWPDNVDFNPATLHDWPLYAAALKKQALQWEKARLARLRKPAPRAKVALRAKSPKVKHLVRGKV